MKSVILLLLFLSGITTAIFGQNYSCISPEVKTYFSNNSHYLRGMRIDSTIIDSVAITYFPFKTGRVDDFDNQNHADSTGGNWFGKRIVETTAGITYFLTKSNDTITIKNNADVNDSWVFYQDTISNTIYEAKVTARDTFTINGISDSVKLMTIKAFDTGANEIASDPLNNLKLILSKAHGFIQAIDFYLFPYRPLTNGQPFAFDAYFPLANGDPFQMKKENLTFKRIDFQPVYQDVLLDIDVGDEFYTSESSQSAFGGTSSYQMKTMVTNKVIDSDSIQYEMNYWKTGYYTNPNTGMTNVSDSGISSAVVKHVLVFDLDKMPEEWGNPSIFYYDAQDTSFCVRSLSYSINTGPIYENGELGNFEPSGTRRTYKVKIGTTYFENYATVVETIIGSRSVEAVKKNQYNCDIHNQLLAVQLPEMEMDFKLFPNPAKDWVTIDLPESNRKDKMTLTLFNISGQRLDRIETTKNKVLLNIQNKLPGMYLIQITTKRFSVVRKIVVE